MLGGRFRAEMPRRFGGFFRNDADHRDFTAIGTAAGLSYILPLRDSHSVSIVAWYQRQSPEEYHACNSSIVTSAVVVVAWPHQW